MPFHELLPSRFLYSEYKLRLRSVMLLCRQYAVCHVQMGAGVTKEMCIGLLLRADAAEATHVAMGLSLVLRVVPAFKHTLIARYLDKDGPGHWVNSLRVRLIARHTTKECRQANLQ